MVGGAPEPSPGSTLATAADTFSGERSRSVGVGAKRRALTRRGHVRAHDARAVTCGKRDLAPADAPVERAIPEGKRSTGPSRDVDHVEAERLQTAGAGTGDDTALEHAEWSTLPVEREHELSCEPRRVTGSTDLCAELVRRDLREVERVANVGRVARELDSRVAVDGEVAEWVRRCRSGRQ